MRNRARSALPVVSLVLLAAACELGLDPVELQFEPSDWAMAQNEDLEDDPAALAQIAGALTMLFGTPQAPGFMRPQEWVDDELYRGSGFDEFSEERWAEIVADNTARFAKQLAAIEAGDLEAVRIPVHALGLDEYWQASLEEWSAAEEDGGADAWLAENREDLVYAFAEYYPSLRESAELFRLQCVHCHGPSGGGDGPTAPFLEPRPRDYRRGIFKFTALADKSRPRREDLYRVLTEGIYTTAMPSFRRFTDADLEGLVDYVRLLSIRGETELLLALEYDYDSGLPLEVVQETYLDVWSKWDAAYEHVIAYDGEVPDATPERIAHGRELYMDAKGANCVSCHGQTGRGDGASAFEVVVEPDGTEKTQRVADDWGEKIQVRDLTRGLYHFGRRPIDLFRRVHAGINGTPMPSHAALKKPDGSRLLSDDDLWDIVFYARFLGTRPLHAHAASDEHGASH